MGQIPWSTLVAPGACVPGSPPGCPSGYRWWFQPVVFRPTCLEDPHGGPLKVMIPKNSEPKQKYTVCFVFTVRQEIELYSTLPSNPVQCSVAESIGDSAVIAAAYEGGFKLLRGRSHMAFFTKYPRRKAAPNGLVCKVPRQKLGPLYKL